MPSARADRTRSPNLATPLVTGGQVGRSRLRLRACGHMFPVHACGRTTREFPRTGRPGVQASTIPRNHCTNCCRVAVTAAGKRHHRHARSGNGPETDQAAPADAQRRSWCWLNGPDAREMRADWVGGSWDWEEERCRQPCHEAYPPSQLMVTESTGRIHVVLPQEMRSRRDDDEGKRETCRTSTRTAVDGDDGCGKLQCRPINNNIVVSGDPSAVATRLARAQLIKRRLGTPLFQLFFFFMAAW